MLLTRQSSQVLRHISPRALLSASTSSYTAVATTLQHTRASSFLNDNSIPSRSRKPQSSTGGSWFSRRRKQRTARSKISTLALDPQMMGLPVKQQDLQDSNDHQKQHDKKGETQPEETAKVSRRTRKLLIWCTVLSMPIWGQDILEAVVPGVLGVVIFVAGKIKSGVVWVRSPFTSTKPDS